MVSDDGCDHQVVLSHEEKQASEACCQVGSCLEQAAHWLKPSLCLLYLGAPVPPEQWQATGELLILLYIKTGNQAATVAIGLQPILEQTKYFF